MSAMNLIDSIADEAGAQYRSLLAAITGHFAQALDSSDPTTPKARSDFHHTLTRISDAFMGVTDEFLVARTKAVQQLALDASGHTLSDAERADLDEYVSETLADLQEQFRVILRRDDLTVDRELRKVALNVDLLQSAGGMSKVGALIRVKFGRVRGLRFVQPDRLGRVRVSEEYVRTLVRQHMLLTYIETTLFVLAKQGIDIVRVTGDASSRGEVFSITGATDGFQTYEQIKSIAFHPNSRAFVEAVR